MHFLDTADMDSRFLFFGPTVGPGHSYFLPS